MSLEDREDCGGDQLDRTLDVFAGGWLFVAQRDHADDRVFLSDRRGCQVGKPGVTSRMMQSAARTLTCFPYLQLVKIDQLVRREQFGKHLLWSQAGIAF